MNAREIRDLADLKGNPAYEYMVGLIRTHLQSVEARMERMDGDPVLNQAQFAAFRIAVRILTEEPIEAARKLDSGEVDLG
jgi:hypothetical protein